MVQNFLARPWNFEVADARSFLQPVNAGVEAGYRDRQQNVENERQNKLMQFRQQAETRAQQKFDAESEDAKVTRWGREASAIMGMQGPQSQAAWQNWLQRNPEVATHAQSKGIDLNDHVNGPRFIATEAGVYDDLKRRQAEAAIASSRASTESSLASSRRDAELHPLKKDLLTAQTRQANQKDEMGGLITGMVRGAMGGPQPPPLQPQSFEGDGDPNLIRTAGPQDPQSAGSMFEGKSPAEKRRIGEALLLDPRTKGLGEQLIKDAERGGIGTAGGNELDKEIIAKATDVADLNNIRAAFKPEFLGLEGRAKSMALDWKDWISSKNTTPDEQKFLTEYTRMATATTERLNNRMKLMAGTAVSGAEEKRQYAANPTMRDSPTVFKAKLDAQIEMQRMAIARYNWLKHQYKGTPDDIHKLAQTGRIEAWPLDGMKQRINDTLEQRAQQLRQTNPNMDERQLRDALAATRKQVFGI